MRFIVKALSPGMILHLAVLVLESADALQRLVLFRALPIALQIVLVQIFGEVVEVLWLEANQMAT
jgi:hypothetical protein